MLLFSGCGLRGFRRRRQSAPFGNVRDSSLSIARLPKSPGPAVKQLTCGQIGSHFYLSRWISAGAVKARMSH